MFKLISKIKTSILNLVVRAWVARTLFMQWFIDPIVEIILLVLPKSVSASVYSFVSFIMGFIAATLVKACFPLPVYLVYLFVDVVGTFAYLYYVKLIRACDKNKRESLSRLTSLKRRVALLSQKGHEVMTVRVSQHEALRKYIRNEELSLTLEWATLTSKASIAFRKEGLENLRKQLTTMRNFIDGIRPVYEMPQYALLA